MKNAKMISVTILMMALAGVGCSNKSSSNEVPLDPAGVPAPLPLPLPPPANPEPTPETGGSNTVPFVPVSFAEMNSYVATRPLNNPTNIKLTVDMTADSEGRYYGQVKIAYDDNGYRYEGVFDSGSGTNSYLQYSGNNGLKEYAYNVWFMHGGKAVFSGFFQDPYGGVVLVIDNYVTQDLGDGQGGQVMVSGSVWYRNFPYLQAPQGPERKCWYITQGPYDCRSNAVIYKNALEPSDSYTKLGTFSGLSLSKAFH